jgi:hypothetical protein
VNEFGATGEEEVVEENNYTTAYAAPTYILKFQSIPLPRVTTLLSHHSTSNFFFHPLFPLMLKITYLIISLNFGYRFMFP